MNEDDHTAAVNRSVAGSERQTTAFAESARQWTSVAAAVTSQSFATIDLCNISAAALAPFDLDRAHAGRRQCRQRLRRLAPDNGLEVLYASASFNDKMLGHGEPVRVREGQRVLFRLLNASPTENVTLALAGHRLTVITLDGNPVPSPQIVDTLFLAPAERADEVIE